MSDLKPFLVRLTPQSVELLNTASKDQEKTKAGLINEAYLTADINSRLSRLR